MYFVYINNCFLKNLIYAKINHMKNIVLIGMPGAGKTTLGKAIANDLKMNFIDGDELIIEKTGLKLQQILNDQGIDKFFEI